MGWKTEMINERITEDDIKRSYWGGKKDHNQKEY